MLGGPSIAFLFHVEEPKIRQATEVSSNSILQQFILTSVTNLKWESIPNKRKNLSTTIPTQYNDDAESYRTNKPINLPKEPREQERKHKSLIYQR